MIQFTDEEIDEAVKAYAQLMSLAKDYAKNTVTLDDMLDFHKCKEAGHLEVIKDIFIVAAKSKVLRRFFGYFDCVKDEISLEPRKIMMFDMVVKINDGNIKQSLLEMIQSLNEDNNEEG